MLMTMSFRSGKKQIPCRKQIPFRKHPPGCRILPFGLDETEREAKQDKTE
jgi:hypothetical protein